MDKEFLYSIIWTGIEVIWLILATLYLISLVGCASQQPFHKVIIVPKMEVHIVETIEQLGKNRVTGESRLGFWRKGEIWVTGEMWRGKIYPDS